jgi:hypothetical protein
MVEAAANGLPVIGSNKIGEFERINGNGLTYEEDNLGNLANASRMLSLSDVRGVMGKTGRKKMFKIYS